MVLTLTNGNPDDDKKPAAKPVAVTTFTKKKNQAVEVETVLEGDEKEDDNIGLRPNVCHTTPSVPVMNPYPFRRKASAKKPPMPSTPADSPPPVKKQKTSATVVSSTKANGSTVVLSAASPSEFSAIIDIAKSHGFNSRSICCSASLFTATMDEDWFLTDTQEQVLSVSSQIPVLLSTLGSCVIIYHVCQKTSAKDASNLPASNRRILLGLSVSDVLFSVAFALSPYLNGKAMVWSVGNAATCTFLATWQQFSTAALVFYNGILSLYFVMTVRWGWSQRDFGRKVEPFLHMFILGFATITSVTGAALDLYAPTPIGPGCWLKPLPEGCDPTSNCEMKVGMTFMGVPIVISLVMLIVDNLLLYCFVRKTILRGFKYDMSRQGSFTAQRSFKPLSESIRSTTQPQMSLSRISNASESAFSVSSTRRSQADAKIRRVRDVGTQSLLYVASFFITFFWTWVLRVLFMTGTWNTQQLFPLTVIESLFLPSQGFFNMLVFLRPTYLRFRRKFSNQSRWWAFRKAVSGDADVLRKESTRVSNSRSKGQASAEVVAEECAPHNAGAIGEECAPPDAMESVHF